MPLAVVRHPGRCHAKSVPGVEFDGKSGQRVRSGDAEAGRNGPLYRGLGFVHEIEGRRCTTRKILENRRKRRKRMNNVIASVHASFSLFSGVCGERRSTFGAEEGTRTPTPLRVRGPEPRASANSATSARFTSSAFSAELAVTSSLANAAACVNFSAFRERLEGVRLCNSRQKRAPLPQKNGKPH